MKKASIILFSLAFYAITIIIPSLSLATTPTDTDLEKKVIAQVQDFLNETQKYPFQVTAKNITFTAQDNILVLKDVSFTFKAETFYSTGTISTLTFKNFDYSVFDNGFDKTELYKIANSISIEALITHIHNTPESTKNKATITVASTELYNLACRLDDFNQNATDSMFVIPHYIKAFAFDKALWSNITVHFPFDEKMIIKTKINAILFENLQAGVLKYTEINNLLVDSPALFIALDAGKLYENHLTDMLTWILEADKEKDTFENFIQTKFLGGVDLTNAHANFGNSKIFSFDSFLSRSQYGAEYTYSHKIKNLKINTDFFRPFMSRNNIALFHALDISTKAINQTLELSLNKQYSTLTIPNFTTSIENYGLLQATVTVTSTDPAEMLNESNAALKNLTFIYSDEGYVPSLIKRLAVSERQTPETYMTFLFAMLDILFAELENQAENETHTANLAAIKEAIQSFLKNPQEITLTFLPDEPFVFAESSAKSSNEVGNETGNDSDNDAFQSLGQQLIQGKIKLEYKEK